MMRKIIVLFGSIVGVFGDGVTLDVRYVNAGSVRMSRGRGVYRFLASSLIHPWHFSIVMRFFFDHFPIPFENHSGYPLKVGGHLRHESGVSTWAIARDECCKECSCHVQGVYVFFGFGVCTIL